MELLFFAIFGFLTYFIPAIVAQVRYHNNGAAILMLNLFLGWTILGWIAALIWSVTNNTKKTD